jgi:hypothetical protein
MAKDFELKFIKKNWAAQNKAIVDTDGVKRMSKVADACNTGLESDIDGYLVSVEGDQPLTKRDYRATVITATGEAMRDNAKHNTLVKNFYLAGGDR